MPLRPIAILGLFALLGLRQAMADETCLKQVLGEYCLGGSLQQQLQRKPAGTPLAQRGERSAVIYPQGPERTYLMAYRDRIYKILQTVEPASQLTLKDLNERLTAKYGPHRDLSHYPSYARNQASQLGAVRRGEGELRYSWQGGDAAWRVELGWSRRLGIFVAYLANELDRQQQAAMDSGL